MTPRHGIPGVAAALLCTAGLLTAAPAGAANLSPEMQKVVAEAKKEGKLILQFSPTLLGNVAAVKQLAAGANKMFGTDLELQFTPDPGSIPRNLNKIFVSLQAHKKSPTSVFVSTGLFMNLLHLRKGTMPVDWVKLMPKRINADFTEGTDYAVRVFTTIPGGIVYNTQRAPMKPKALADLLQPSWKGKIASTPYAANFDVLTSEDFQGPEKALTFTKAFAKQVGGLMGCGELERVASGEFSAFAIDCAGRDWVKLKREGAPVAFVVPKELVAQRFYYMAIPANAPTPNAAKLFIAYFLSPEGQKIMWDTDDTDLHMFPDAHMKKVIADYEAEGLHFKQITIAWELHNIKVHKGARENAVKILQGR